MKKKTIIFIICCLILVTIISVFIFFNIDNDDNKESSIILDINPIIELRLKENNIVSEMIALDEDALKIVDNSLKDRNLEEIIGFISNRLIEENFIPIDDDLDILICASSDINIHDIEYMIHTVFDEKNIQKIVTSVESINSKDIELSKEKNISICKSAYINSIIEVNNDISIDYLLESSVRAICEAKENGIYCDKGYFLEGERCFKENRREEAKVGKVCSEGYMGYNGKCYKEGRFTETEKETCYGDFVLKDGKCIRSESYKAEGVCEEGDYNYTDDKCHVRTYTGDAKEYCRDSGRTMYEHKCLATKPTINGKCLGSDVVYKGKCVNMKNDYVNTDWKCTKGRIFDPMGNIPEGGYKCYQETKESPKTYTCNNDNYTLNGKTCFLTEEHKVDKVRVCETGYTLSKDGICLDFNDVKEMVDGLFCDNPHSKIKDDICIIYDVVDAHESKNLKQ